MFTLLLCLLFVISSNSTIQVVCENVKAFVHHDMPKCLEDYDIYRRNGAYDDHWCLNEGTWEGEYFVCKVPTIIRRNVEVVDDWRCAFGESWHSDTCAPEVLRTAEMWFLPNEDNYGRRAIYEDWEWEVLNLRFRGEQGDIHIDEKYPWGEERNPLQTFEDVYESLYYAHKTYLAVTLDYNETCHTTVKVYINGSLVIETDRVLDYYFLTFLRSMSELEETENGDWDSIFFIGEWNIVATDDQIAYLYTLGSNRSADTILTSCEEMDIEGGDSTWQILFWVFTSSLLLLLAAGAIGVVYIYNNRKKSQPKSSPMSDELEFLD